MPQVSIIVPVYKVEPYIRRCLDSIVAQTFTDWECILVDDGSPDKCGVICDEYAAKDSRFKVIHQENQGVTRARANGTAVARGEWITFVDSDDTLPEKALFYLQSNISPKVDIVVGMISNEHVEDEDYLGIYEYRKRLIWHRNITMAPYAKLIRRTLFNPFVFDLPRELVVGEDAIANIRLAFRTDKPVKVCKEIVYNYKINSGSISNRFETTSEYEYTYYLYKVESVPEQYRELYKREIIHYSVYRYLEITIDKLYLSAEDRVFQSLLAKEISKSGYNEFSFVLRKLFYAKNVLYRCLLIFLKSFSKTINKKFHGYSK